MTLKSDLKTSRRVIFALVILVSILAILVIATDTSKTRPGSAGKNNVQLFGRVVDQYGNPLVGAKIAYEIAGRFDQGGRGSLHSGGNGNFRISARGDSLTIWNIEYPNAMYTSLLEGKHGITDMYTKGNDIWGYDRSRNSLNWHNYSYERPLLFDLWVFDPAEAARYAGDIRFGDGWVKVPPDGQPQTVRFDSRRRSVKLLPGVDPDGDLVLSCQRPPMQKNTDTGDWEARLAPVNGGIIRSPERYLNLAPASGYQRVETLGFSLDEPDYRSALINQRYYFVSQDNQRVGALLLDIRPFEASYDYATKTYDEQYCQFSFEYKLNTAGIRYLYKQPRF